MIISIASQVVDDYPMQFFTKKQLPNQKNIVPLQQNKKIN